MTAVDQRPEVDDVLRRRVLTIFHAHGEMTRNQLAERYQVRFGGRMPGDAFDRAIRTLERERAIVVTQRTKSVWGRVTVKWRAAA